MGRVIGFIVLLLAGFVSSVFAAPPDPPPPFIKGQIVVAGKPGDVTGQTVIKYLPLSKLTVLAVTPGRELAAIKQQRQKGRRAMLNLKAQALAATGDPLSSYQWNFDKVQAQSAWQTSTGSGVTVAVLDTGLKRGGPDGIGCVSTGIDIVNSDTNPSDGNGHGTHVSGTVAQATDNGVGVAGLAYGACVMPVKVLSDSGSGSFADIAEGIYWAVDHGARVINMSLGVSARYSITNDPVMDPALDYAEAKGVTVVAAAGNDGFRKNVSYPAIYPTTIAVGATDDRNQRVSYSNQGTGLDLMAPGGDTNRDDNGDGYPDGVLQETYYNGAWGYYFFQGTSMATPHVTAAVAILLQQDSQLTPADIRDRLETTALDLGSSGYDSSYGYGLIQIADALNASGTAPSNMPPTASFSANCTDLTCSFDASNSLDPEGGSLTYSWDFGDGAQSSGVTTTHIYSAYGTYSVKLTVIDPLNASGTQTQDITLSAPTSGGTTCIDNDGDGYCANIAPIDCNDNDHNVYPGHNDTKGRWGRDGVDNDCNGIIDG